MDRCYEIVDVGQVRGEGEIVNRLFVICLVVDVFFWFVGVIDNCVVNGKVFVYLCDQVIYENGGVGVQWYDLVKVVVCVQVYQFLSLYVIKNCKGIVYENGVIKFYFNIVDGVSWYGFGLEVQVLVVIGI